ncbi:hypothetical protein B0181_10905 [Moraxella caviae]|uniref:DUF669 domain-containing protein n=1 Tax=Moraxella caviae TaxID=34060 RepID=A0A1S9ZUN1_9GAMM|nr:hypothetical protein [Moraxella caviae]OOR87188.1 hypothetical protein B0181_10905 [Moraxella caviae]STZ14005.1 Uncharacterised protein [Moraxella caviae]VEW12859.1 Uncharacterised protein [Moraxella caviae]
MSYFFTRNDQSAKKAGGSSRLSAHEFHAAKITQAYWGVSQGGAKFLSVNFVNANNETADDIKIYFENSSGEQLSGYHQINAILAFNNIAGLNQTQGTYKTYDFEAGCVVDKQGLIASEMIGAYVGVIFSENHYNGQNGIKHNLNLSAVYHHQSTQNAKQFLENLPPAQGQIEGSIAYAKKSSENSRNAAERETNKNNGSPTQGYQRQYPQGMMASPDTAMQRPPQTVYQNDDIPF